MADKINTLRPEMVFPTTKLEPVNKIISEGNLTRLINNLLDLDSYIIPLNDPAFDITYTEWDNALGKTLILFPPNMNPATNVEVMLHGYYFNLGTALSLAGELSSGQRLFVKIIVDTTVENYPELFGELADSTSVTIPGDVTENTVLDEAYRKKDIIEISAVSTDDVTYYFTLNENWKLVLNLDPGVETPTFNDGYTVTYATYYNLIRFYKLNIDDEDLPAEDVLTLPSSYEEYSLEVMGKDSLGNPGNLIGFISVQVII